MGRSGDIGQRYRQHLTGARGKIGGADTYRADWIKELHREGLNPGLLVLDPINSLAVKAEWIESLSDW